MACFFGATSKSSIKVLFWLAAPLSTIPKRPAQPATTARDWLQPRELLLL